MTWWMWVGLAVLGIGLLFWWAARAVAHDERKLTVSWWAARNGFRYTDGTAELLGYFRGAPFDRGTSADMQYLVTGTVAERPAMIMQFSWYHLPSGSRSESTGQSGLRSGYCSAAVLELPGPVPDLMVRRETGADRARGRDLQLESEQFNDAFRITGTDDKFSYDVLNPRMMQWLLADPRAQRFAFRFDGPMLVVWNDDRLDGATGLGELADFAATLFGLMPTFVYTGHRLTEDQTQVPISRIPESAHGRTSTGALVEMQRFTHRGHDVERYEHVRELWDQKETAISVKITLPTHWPTLMIASKRLIPKPRIARFDDGVLSGQERFDLQFACGSPRPDFAAIVLTQGFTDLVLASPVTSRTTIVLQAERLTPQDDGVAEETVRSGVWVTIVGHLADQDLANQITELACDLFESLPPAVLGYHLDNPVPPPPVGGYPNVIPGYRVERRHRV